MAICYMKGLPCSQLAISSWIQNALWLSDMLVSLSMWLERIVSSKWVVTGLNTGDHLHLFEAPAAANEACKLCCCCEEEEWRLMTNRPICTSRNWSDLNIHLRMLTVQLSVVYTISITLTWDEGSLRKLDISMFAKIQILLLVVNWPLGSLEDCLIFPFFPRLNYCFCLQPGCSWKPIFGG